MADPYRSNGSAAYDVRRRNTAQPLEQPERLPDAPARRKPARHVRARLGISPLTALGAAAAVPVMDVSPAGEAPVPGGGGKTFLNVALDHAGHPEAAYVPRRVEVVP